MGNDFKAPRQEHELIINYLSFRKALGFMGIGLPILLILCSPIWNNGQIEASISNYYYTNLRDIFVVTLCAMSLFLITYRGRNEVEKWITNLAGLFGLITAFVPTSFKHDIFLPAYQIVSKIKPYRVVSLDALDQLDAFHQTAPHKIIPADHVQLMGTIHLVSASLFFLLLGYLSYFQFGKTAPQNSAKRRWFRVCGIIIGMVILALIPCASDRFAPFYTQYKLVFWGETICLFAFGFSWLIKGRLIMKDVH